MNMAEQEALVGDLAIPPRPQVVTVLVEEMGKDAPDLARISRQISADVGLAAAMLKAVNSPLYRRERKISTVSQAISLLGLRNVSSLATGLVVRHAMGSGGSSAGLELFWDSAEKCALLCAFLARKIHGIAEDEAYTYGLFHNCGIPLLLKRFPDYSEVLAKATADHGEATFTSIEDLSVGTNHGVVGYFMARSWHLSDAMSQAILHHHDVHVFSHGHDLSPAAINLIAIGHLAEHMHHSVQHSADDFEWERFSLPVLAHFGLSEDEFAELLDDSAGLLKNI
jgi:HD-like signal output (HDOD) protein